MRSPDSSARCESFRSFVEFLTVAFVPEARVTALRVVQCFVVSTVSAVVLASHLALDTLTYRAHFVSHVILKPVSTNLCPDYDNFFLWNPDGLVTLGTNVHAQPDQPIGTQRLGKCELMIVEPRCQSDEREM